MNKKRLAIFVLILIVIIAVVCTIILNGNKKEDNKGQKENIKTYTEAEWKEFATNIDYKTGSGYNLKGEPIQLELK